MSPTRNTSLAEKMPEPERRPQSERVLKVLQSDETTDRKPEQYSSPSEAIRSNLIAEVVFSDLGEDCVQIVPYDAKLTGYGDFTMSWKEFQALIREFPKTDFTPIREFAPRIDRKVQLECRRKGVKRTLSDAGLERK